MSYTIVIPARYASTRLPGKVLLPVAGMSMLQRVWQCATDSGAEQVWIAADDERVLDAARGFGASVCATGTHHVSGTDRIYELCVRQGFAAGRVIVNLQADEPMMPPALPDQLAAVLDRYADADIASLYAPLAPEDRHAPDIVKVVCDARGRALYFSRAPIPYGQKACLRHIGLYAYRVDTLRRLSALPPAPLEHSEHLEQLRALYHGLSIQMEAACVEPGEGIDTPEDLERLRRQLEADSA